MSQLLIFSLAAQLKIGCLDYDLPPLLLAASPKLASMVPIVGILLHSMAYVMASTLAFASFIAAL